MAHRGRSTSLYQSLAYTHSIADRLELQTGACIEALEKHEYQITSLCWQPDGKGFISGGMDGRVQGYVSRVSIAIGQSTEPLTSILCVTGSRWECNLRPASHAFPGGRPRRQPKWQAARHHRPSRCQAFFNLAESFEPSEQRTD